MSEKPVTELLRKSGIIDKHIKEFEKWRLIDQVEGEFNTSAERMVGDLVRDIADLLDKEPVMRQTMVAPIVTREAPRLWYGYDEVFSAVMDEMGRLVAAADVRVVRGDIVWREGEPKTNYTVMEVEKIYENNVVSMKLITIEKE